MFKHNQNNIQCLDIVLILYFYNLNTVLIDILFQYSFYNILKHTKQYQNNVPKITFDIKSAPSASSFERNSTLSTPLQSTLRDSIASRLK